MSQAADILAYCKAHGSITVREASVDLEINSARKVISDMRKSPEYIVDDIPETRVNSKGETKRYKRYFIKAVADNG